MAAFDALSVAAKWASVGRARPPAPIDCALHECGVATGLVVAAMNARADRGTDDGESLLGKLPRSRPGQRSQKRAGPSGSARDGAPVGPPAAYGHSDARAKHGTPSAPPSASDRAEEPGGGSALGPLGDAAHLAGRAARVGIDLAGGVLKRLPRP